MDCSSFSEYTVALAGAPVDVCYSVVLHRLQGDNLLHHSVLRGLQGNLLPLFLLCPWC